MVGWLYRWMGWDKTVTPPRLLFWFSDWSGTRSIDPLVAERTLVAEYGPDWVEGLRHIAEPVPAEATPEQVTAHYRKLNDLRTQLFAASAKAFRLKDFDPADQTGVTDLQKLYVLRNFVDYYAGLGRYLAGE